MACLDCSAGSGPEPLPTGTISDQLLKTGDIGSRITILSQQAVLAMADQLGHTALIRAHDRATCRHRLQTGIRAVFPETGKQKNVCLAKTGAYVHQVKLAQVVDRTFEFLRPQGREKGLSQIMEQVLSYKHEGHLKALQNGAGDLHAEMDALEPFHSAGEKDHETIAGQVKLVTEIELLLRVKQLQVNAIGDHPNRPPYPQLALDLPGQKPRTRGQGMNTSNSKKLQEGTTGDIPRGYIVVRHDEPGRRVELDECRAPH